MSYRGPIRLFVALLGCLALASGFAGCASSKSLKFTNVSDSWLDVRIFVGSAALNPEQSSRLVNRRTFQIPPGKTVSYTPLGHPLVHVQVEPVTASWQSSGKQSWLELLTPPPVNIVASGSGGRLDFDTGPGTVALIPERELKRGRYQYTVAGVRQNNYAGR